MSRGTALITGASSGIGAAFARLFAAEGFDLVLTARREQKLQALADDIPTATKILVLPGDLSTSAGITAFCDSVSRQSLEIDVLVNNAGMMVEEEFPNLTPEQIERTITLNITALTLLIHQFLPAMKARKSGRILNVASVAAFHPVPGMDIYAATKAYVLSFSEALSENLRDTGVSVTALCPGLTDTDMVDTSSRRGYAGFYGLAARRGCPFRLRRIDETRSYLHPRQRKSTCARLGAAPAPLAGPWPRRVA